MPISRRGSALLAVLWLSAALAAIAFALSTTVRAETDRAATSAEGMRAHYLASGGVHRAAMEVLWSAFNPAQRRLPEGVVRADLNFPEGVAQVEIIPETAKLNVNTAPALDLYRLCIALGLAPDRARDIAGAIVDWRQPAATLTDLDQYYLSLTPSFRPPHTSFQEIEELLLVKGVTPDIFYGHYQPAREGETGPRLVRHEGLADCLSVYASGGAVDANSASPAVLAAVGLPQTAIDTIVARRRSAPLTADQLPVLIGDFEGITGRLRIGGNSMVTIRSIARLRLPGGGLSDLRRGVAAQLKFAVAQGAQSIHILRWYDSVWSD
jgi:general secretion pathway protein K